MLVLFGLRPATVGVQSVIAFVVFGRFVEAPVPALGLAALVACGAAIEALIVLVLHLPPTLRIQRIRLGAGFAQLGELARDPGNRMSLASAEGFDLALMLLQSPALFGRSDARELRALVDAGRRIRLEVISLAGLRERLDEIVSNEQARALDALWQAVSYSTLAISSAIARPVLSRLAIAAADEVSSRVEALVVIEAMSDSSLGAQYGEHLRAPAGQLRACARLLVARDVPTHRPVSTAKGSVRRPLREVFGADLHVLRPSLTLSSPAMRHAIRLAIAVPVALLVADALKLPRPYWVPFSVAVVLKSDFSSLFRRGLGRVIGTILGATSAALVIGGLHPGHAVVVVLVGVCAFAAYSLWQAGFAVAVSFVTALVLILLSTTQTDPLSTGLDRLIDTVTGGAIALLAYVVWPTWSAADAYEALASLVRAQRDYLDVVLHAVQGELTAEASISQRARLARLAWANAESAIGRSLDEPLKHRMDPAFCNGALASARRIIQSVHSLRVETERGITVAPLVELDVLRIAFVDALEMIAVEMTTSDTHPRRGLRTAFHQVSLTLGALDAPPSIALQLDELVDAIDTLDALLAGRDATA